MSKQTKSWTKQLPNQCSPVGYREDDFDHVAHAVDALIDRLQAKGFPGDVVARGLMHRGTLLSRFMDGNKAAIEECKTIIEMLQIGDLVDDAEIKPLSEQDAAFMQLINRIHDAIQAEHPHAKREELQALVSKIALRDFAAGKPH